MLCSSGVEAEGLDVSGTLHSIVPYQSSNCRVVNNEVRDSSVGVYLHWSNENTIVDDNFTDTGILLHGHTSGNIITSNTFNGKQILYLEGVSGLEIIGDYTQILLVNSKNVRIRDLRLHTLSSASTESVNVASAIMENNNITYSPHWMYMTLSNSILIKRNSITNTRNFTRLIGVIDNRLIENYVINCDIGIAVTSTSGSGASDIRSSSVVVEVEFNRRLWR